MIYKLFLSMLLFGLAMGCSKTTPQESAQPASDTANSSAANQVVTQVKHVPPPPPPVETAVTAEKSQSKKSNSASKEPESPTPRPGMVIEKADVGAGAKGRYEQGIITTPVATYFRAQEKISFYIQIPDCIRAYKFEHDFKGPKSNEEFMDKIIKKNGIQLPTLPPGHRYIYDPKTEQLMVEKPQ